jgi:hypothetical protein
MADVIILVLPYIVLMSTLTGVGLAVLYTVTEKVDLTRPPKELAREYTVWFLRLALSFRGLVGLGIYLCTLLFLVELQR